MQRNHHLSKEQYNILRHKATEPAFSGKYYHFDKQGYYACAGCGNILFSSEHKIESSCGWPCFEKAVVGSVNLFPDNSFGLKRTEVCCANCHSHLGHFFIDEPQKKRYCINSLALEFFPQYKN